MNKTNSYLLRLPFKYLARVCLVFLAFSLTSCDSSGLERISLPKVLFQGDSVGIGEDFEFVVKRRGLRKDSSTGLWVEDSPGNRFFTQATYDSKNGKLAFFSFYKLVTDSVEAEKVAARLIKIFQGEYGNHTVVDDSTFLGLQPKLVWRPVSGFIVTLSYSTMLQTVGATLEKETVRFLAVECKFSDRAIKPSSRFSRLEFE